MNLVNQIRFYSFLTLQAKATEADGGTCMKHSVFKYFRLPIDLLHFMH